MPDLVALCVPMPVSSLLFACLVMGAGVKPQLAKRGGIPSTVALLLLHGCGTARCIAMRVIRAL